MIAVHEHTYAGTNRIEFLGNPLQREELEKEALDKSLVSLQRSKQFSLNHARARFKRVGVVLSRQST